MKAQKDSESVLEDEFDIESDDGSESSVESDNASNLELKYSDPEYSVADIINESDYLQSLLKIMILVRWLTQNWQLSRISW